MSYVDKLKYILKEYGKIGIVTHISLSLSFYGIFYFLISRKFIDPKKYLKKIGYKDSSNKVETAGDMLLAYILYKATMLLRLPLTIALVPIVAKILRRKN